MTSQAIERHQAAAGGALALNDREIRSIEFQARAIAALDRRLDDNAERRKEQALALAVTLYSLGLPVTVTNAKKLHLIGDEVVESAQLLLGLLAMHGHEVRIIEDSDERAVVRGHRHGGGEPHTVTYTIDQARRSGALDEWVEKWETTSGGKKYPVRYFLVFEGAPNTVPPEPWAKTLIDRHQVKRMDAWHKYRSDMLVNRALRRLAKRMGADALLGVGGPADDPPARIPARDDDMVVDVEEEDEEEPVPGGRPEEGPDPAAAHRNECGRIASAMSRIPDGLWRQQWAKAWREAGLPSNAHELADEQLEPARQLIRQYLALSTLDAVGVTGTKDRHAFVLAATNGATESTKGLTAEQLQAVLKACEVFEADRLTAEAEAMRQQYERPDGDPEYGPDEEPF